MRHRSCYLRLVVDAHDQALRPQQTLLVSDLVDQNGASIEILDHDVQATYRCAGCPNQGEAKCILARHTIPLVRGHNVEVEARILRAQPNGATLDSIAGDGDDNSGVVGFTDVRNRVERNCRRIWAQHALSFTLARLEIVDPPSSMLTVSEPDGAASSGQNPGATGQGQVGFTLDVDRFDSNGVVALQVGPIAIAGGRTAMATAQDLANAITQLNVAGLNVNVSANAPVDQHLLGSVDVVLTLAGGRAVVNNLSNAAVQDAQQQVAAVTVDVNNFRIRSHASDSFVGSPMQRNLFKCFVTDEHHINIFVVQATGDGVIALATSKHAQLPVPQQASAEVANCIVIAAAAMDGNYDTAPTTLAHELGHLLTDNLGHSTYGGNPPVGSLMFQMVTDAFPSQIAAPIDYTKRIPSVAHEFDVNMVIPAIPPLGMNVIQNVPGQPIGLATQTFTFAQRIALNNTLTFNAR